MNVSYILQISLLIIRLCYPHSTSNALFTFHWQADGSVAFQANNGKFVATKKSGHLFANAEGPDDEAARYYFYLINRWAARGHSLSNDNR